MFVKINYAGGGEGSALREPFPGGVSGGTLSSGRDVRLEGREGWELGLGSLSSLHPKSPTHLLPIFLNESILSQFQGF